MSAPDPAPPDDVLTALERICKESGALMGVSPAYYQWFFAMGDQAMSELVRLLVLNRAEDINHLIFQRKGKEVDLLNMVHTWLRLVARGYLQFGPDGDLLFFKPTGPEPTSPELEKIEARIASTNDLIRTAILAVLNEGKGER